MFLAPAFMAQADQDKDDRITSDEFAALGRKWYTSWDKSDSSRITNDQLRDGLNATLAPPGGPGGFGRPGGPAGGRGPGLMLQGPEGKRNGLASAMGIEFEYVRADLEFEGQSFKNVAVRYKGNGTFIQSRGTLKRSLKIDLNKHVDDQEVAGVSTLNLHNCFTDASWMNEVLSHRLYRDAGVPAPRTSYARVHVTVPGKHERKYFGLYSIVEDVGKAFGKDRFRVKNGAIFKPVTPALFGDLGDEWARYDQTYDPKTNTSKAEKQRVIELAKLVTHGSDEEFAKKLPEFVDLDNFSRFMAVTVYLSTLDSILGAGQNYYVYLHPETNKFHFIPWDLDHSFGQFFLFGTQSQRENLSIHKPWMGENRFLERAFKVQAFKQLYLERLEEFGETIFKPARFHEQVDEIAAAIRPAVQEESAEKLARFDKAVAGNPVEPAGFGPPPREGNPPPPMPRFGGFGQALKPIKAFVTPRAQSVADQLAGKAEGNTLQALGFGGPGRGGPGGPGGPPRNFGPGVFLAPAFMNAFDADKDNHLTRDEFTGGFANWFSAWNTDANNPLTDEELRSGINKAFAPPPGGFGGPPGGTPPQR
jgi:spore coat protein CotH